MLERLYGGPVRIQRLPGPDLPLMPQQLARLGIADAAAALHRRVHLLRGELVLSEADLWYVPARLEPEMAAALLATDTPFGRIVAPLQPRRINLSAVLHPAGEVALEHRAVLQLPDGRPLAEVHERYPRR